MRIFGIEIKRAGQAYRHSLTDEERELSLEVRQMKAAQRRTQHQIEMAEMQLELAELQEKLSEYEDDDEDETEGLFKNFLLPKILGNQAVNEPQPVVAATLDDAAIEDMLTKLPDSYKKIAKNLPDGVIDGFLQKHTPYDDVTRKRAIELFRAKNI